jgi:hypothetical protein
LLVLYHFNIHYLPELEWRESLTYLVALSLLGGLVAILYSLLLFFPGLIWSEFLIHDSELEKKLCYQVPSGHFEACYRKVGHHMAFPFFIFMAAMHVAALASESWVLPLTAGILLLLISIYLAWRFLLQLEDRTGETLELLPMIKGALKSLWRLVTNKKDLQPTPGSSSSLLLKYVVLFNISALISLVSLLFLYAIVDPDEGSWMLVICTCVVVATNLLVAVQYRRRPGRAVVTAILATLVLLGCEESKSLSGQQESLSSQLMAGFGIGADEVMLIAKNEAIPILKGHKVQHETNHGVVTIENARILSRLGREYFIEAAGRRVVIPRELVLSWSTPATPADR